MESQLVCPYQPGNTITFRDEEGQAIQFQILHLYGPPNLAFVMQVSALDRPDLPEKMVLKVVDFRWLTTAREREGLPPWSPDREQTYISSVLDGHVDDYWKRVRDDQEYWERDDYRKKAAATNLRILKHREQSRLEDTMNKQEGFEEGDSKLKAHRDPQTHWSLTDETFESGIGELPRPTIPEAEAAYLVNCEDEFETELDAYQKLEELQGRFIPKLYTSVVSEPWAEAAPEIQAEWLVCHGLLIEYIDGSCLRDLILEHADLDPEKDDLPWGDIARSIACAINIFPSYLFHHDDLHPRNIIVRQGGSYKPEDFVIIDFSKGRFIGPYPRTNEEDENYGSDHSSWHFAEKALLYEILSNSPTIKLRSTGRKELLEYGSCRFGHWFEWDFVSTYVKQNDISEMLIRGDVWRVPENQSPAESLKQKFEQSRKAGRLLWAAQDLFEECKPWNEKTYDYRAGWEPNAITQIAQQVMTDERVYCDPSAAWQAFCDASDDWKNKQDLVIFKQVPWTVPTSLPSPPPTPEPQTGDQSANVVSLRSGERYLMPPEQAISKHFKKEPMSPSSLGSQLSSPTSSHDDFQDKVESNGSSELSQRSDDEPANHTAADTGAPPHNNVQCDTSSKETNDNSPPTIDTDEGNTSSVPDQPGDTLNPHVREQITSSPDDGETASASQPRPHSPRPPKLKVFITALKSIPLPSPARKVSPLTLPSPSSSNESTAPSLSPSSSSSSSSSQASLHRPRSRPCPFSGPLGAKMQSVRQWVRWVSDELRPKTRL